MDITGPKDFDLLVIGGGINGAGIARDAAGRGLSVCLVEKGDLAGATSSASTKLVHGGLRYLEHYEFRLVRESLIERERLLAIAPHIIWPLRFVLPHDAGLRPRWLLRLGLFLYDHIGGRKLLPPARSLDLTRPPHAGVLERRLTRGFEYSDCWVEDARPLAGAPLRSGRHADRHGKDGGQRRRAMGGQGARPRHAGPQRQQSAAGQRQPSRLPAPLRGRSLLYFSEP
jgi:glycerol-3-phosphate dehydrogenase